MMGPLALAVLAALGSARMPLLAWIAVVWSPLAVLVLVAIGREERRW
jgi:hypothetical protein